LQKKLTASAGLSGGEPQVAFIWGRVPAPADHGEHLLRFFRTAPGAFYIIITRGDTAQNLKFAAAIFAVILINGHKGLRLFILYTLMIGFADLARM
jgi:hypothetical protein